ncbi:MAG: aspartate/glutamate racemase family protein [Chitinophagaceae bacterium]|nr:aspartate/glutamate racemase family protein [Chitinophagaceae bacterium]MCA6455142.1 aspartate/glutamate racemase family protein [Chitinophagaceae bacterium]MCA6459918.1 aspartate/glutamate racemase family protein [Chitinophagaceae bacterium]MCA6465777.1 aspartate/glutamate racemase family protein [Chitinophagaceae bacterium]
MKTIGLIGGVTWLSTAEYYRILNEMVNAREGGVSSARIIVFSVNFQEIKTLTEAGDWNSIAGIMCDAARRLERSGADCILLGANTMHKIADAVQEAVAIPLIHVAVVTASAIKQQQIRTVALLGTKYVMQQDFYRQKLEEQGLQVLIPSQADIDYINNAIYTEFAKGIFTEEAKQRFLQIIDTLVAQGASGAIFGCTEIPILLKQEDCSIPVFDTTLLHATAAVDFVLS